MNRFSSQNNFGWTFFVLIFAALWSATNVESGASSNVAANESAVFASYSPNSSQNQDVENAALSTNGVSTPQLLDRSRRGCARSAFEFESSPRFERTVRLQSFQTTNPRVVERDGFALLYRSIWACQTVSRPLFLLLLTLRN